MVLKTGAIRVGWKPLIYNAQSHIENKQAPARHWRMISAWEQKGLDALAHPSTKWLWVTTEMQLWKTHMQPWDYPEKHFQQR